MDDGEPDRVITHIQRNNGKWITKDWQYVALDDRLGDGEVEIRIGK